MAKWDHQEDELPERTRVQRLIDAYMKALNPPSSATNYWNSNGKRQIAIKEKKTEVLRSFKKIYESYLEGEVNYQNLQNWIEHYSGEETRMPSRMQAIVSAFATELCPDHTQTPDRNTQLAALMYSMAKKYELLDKKDMPGSHEKFEHKYQVASALEALALTKVTAKPDEGKINTAVFVLADTIIDNHLYDKSLFKSDTKSKVSQALHELDLSPTQRLTIKLAEQIVKLQTKKGHDQPGNKIHAKLQVCNGMMKYLKGEKGKDAAQVLDELVQKSDGYSQSTFGKSTTAQLLEDLKECDDDFEYAHEPTRSCFGYH